MEVRSATSADVEALCRLINAAFRVERFFIDEDRISPEAALAMMAEGTFFIVGPPAACVYVKKNNERGYFGLLAVDPVRQGYGLGRKMVEIAEDWCRAAGCAEVDIRVVSLREELFPFYEKLEYTVMGTEPFEHPALKHPCHFVRMSKKLLRCNIVSV